MQNNIRINRVMVGGEHPVKMIRHNSIDLGFHLAVDKYVVKNAADALGAALIVEGEYAHGIRRVEFCVGQHTTQ